MKILATNIAEPRQGNSHEEEKCGMTKVQASNLYFLLDK